MSTPKSMNMKKKMFCCAFVLLLMIFMSAQFLVEKLDVYFLEQGIKPEKTDSREETYIQTFQKEEGSSEKEKKKLQLYARSAALLDASSGRILFQKDGNKQMPMASTTKIMTCIVILEHASLNDIVTVSSNAAKQPDVQLNVNTGEQYYLEDLLYSLMLESHNDVAVALAEHVGGSVEGFAKIMNQKAQELGCRNTHFVTPNGLDAKEHYTTAEELCKIAAYAIQNEKFLEIVNMPSYGFTEITKGRTFCVTNKDRFLTMYEGAIGIKTGFTGNAGYCFVGAIKKTDKTLISAVLACGWPPNKNYKWSDTKQLMDYGCRYYTKTKFFTKKITLPDMPVVGGKKEKVSLSVKQESEELLADGSEGQKIVLEIKNKLKAPVKKKQEVGKLYYYINEELYKTEKIYTKETVEEIDCAYVFEKIWNAWAL